MRTAVLAALLGLLAACLSIDRPALDKRRFLLEVSRPEASPAAAYGSLVVAPFHVQAPYAGGGFVHRRGGGEVVADFHTEFFVPPGVLLANLTRRWLGDAGLFATVAGDGTRLPPTHVLEADVLALCVDERPPEGPHAVLELEVVVLDVERRLVYRDRLTDRQTLADLTPETIVSGWNRCGAAVLATLEERLRERLPRD